jgi:hypothetical protein
MEQTTVMSTTAQRVWVAIDMGDKSPKKREAKKKKAAPKVTARPPIVTVESIEGKTPKK